MGEGIAGGEDRVLEVFKNAAMECIGPALRGSRDIGDAAKLGVVVATADAYLRDGVERGKELVDRAAVLDTDAADAIDGVGHERGRGAIDNQVIVVIDLDPGLGAERVDGAGGAGGTRVDGYWKLGELTAGFGFRKIGDIGGDHPRRSSLDHDSFGGCTEF